MFSDGISMFANNPVLFLMLGMLFWGFVIRKGFGLLMKTDKSGAIKKAAIGKTLSVIERMFR